VRIDCHNVARRAVVVPAVTASHWAAPALTARRPRFAYRELVDQAIVVPVLSEKATRLGVETGGQLPAPPVFGILLSQLWLDGDAAR
jgi:hypothetical protein